MTSKATPLVTTRQFLTSLLAAAIVLVAFNLLVIRFARNSVPRQLIERIESTPGITTLGLGNSLMAAGFDAAVFDSQMSPAHVLAFNAGLGASSQVEHLTLLREAFRRDPTIKVVIYGFFDFQLTDPPVINNSDLIGNLAASYYLEPAIAAQYYQMSTRDRVEFEAMRFFPMMVERGNIWAKVELLRRAVDRIGMPHIETNQFGRASDFALLEARSREAFAASCENWYKSGAGLNEPVSEMIRESHAHGAAVVIVEMPMAPYHRRQFYSLAEWDRYRQKVRKLVQEAGAEYISASDWISDPRDFADHLHLRATGAGDFSRELALYLRNSPYRASYMAPSSENDASQVP
ncbi:MAG TPA: SGNH/GDSL hydrolase family protein [Candidatus Binataceae bacterium]|nr:SGNH/GDSL hydrolase family protein [Candidatus Binataceae bacterium]